MYLGIGTKYLLSLLMKKSIHQKLVRVPYGHYVILTYHRILPKSEVTESVEPGMYVTPSTFRRHIKFLKKHFNIVAIDQMESHNNQRKWEGGRKPFCIITFDDGWLDFYKYAWPILRQEDVSSTVFLPTNYIGSAKAFWTDRLALILSGRGYDFFVNTIAGLTAEKPFDRKRSSRENLANAIRMLKGIDCYQIETLLTACEIELGCREPLRRSFMNWDEIRSLFRSGLVSVGSHTVNHAILTNLPKTKIHDELIISRQSLIDENVVGETIPFCYPNGSYAYGIDDMVKQAGYSSAVSCSPGWNTQDTNMFSLNRVALHQDISSTEALLAYRLATHI